MPTWLIIVSGLCGLGIYYGGMALFRAADKKKADRFDAVLTRAGFTWTQRKVGVDGATGIAVNDTENTVCLAVMGRSDESTRVFSANDVLAVEIFEDGESVMRSSRISQAAGAAVGGLVFGGGGAVVGALTGAKTSSMRVRNVVLQLLINDTSNPVHDVQFLVIPVDRKRKEYVDAHQACRHWHGVIKVMMAREQG